MMHFISGLPRAGTTLLAGILRQNPRFHASITSPVGRIVTQALQAMGPQDNEAVTETFLTERQRRDILKGIVEEYYAMVTAPVIFDTNRRWTANIAVLAQLFPQCKVICMLRDPAAIVDSFERQFQRYPLHLSAVYGERSNLTVYERTGAIMAVGGALGYAMNGLKSAWCGPHYDHLVPVEYDTLVQYPQSTMMKIHDALCEPPFVYDFQKIDQIPGAYEFDIKIDTPGLHTLMPELVYNPRVTCLPPDILAALPKPFWPVKEPATTGC